MEINKPLFLKDSTANKIRFLNVIFISNRINKQSYPQAS